VRRQALRQRRQHDRPPGAQFAQEPGPFVAEGAELVWPDTRDGCGGEDVQRAVGGKLAVAAAVVAEEIDQTLQAAFDLRQDGPGGNICEARSELGQQALEGEAVDERERCPIAGPSSAFCVAPHPCSRSAES
jgi:hypothetical protein